MTRLGLLKVALLSIAPLAAVLLIPLSSSANPRTEFSNLNELRGITNDLADPNSREDVWFPPDSNYGRIFLEPGASKLMASWLGTLSKHYSVEPGVSKVSRSLVLLEATYRSRRNEDTPIALELLVPHPRSMSSRTLNLIPDFSNRENLVKQSPTSEHMDISGFPADLGLDLEKGICRLTIPLPRQSLLYMEAKGCDSRQKLLSFCDTIDIVRLAGKLEK